MDRSLEGGISAMVRCYAHLATDHLAAYASKVVIVVANDNRPNTSAIAANDTGHKLGTVGKGRAGLVSNDA